MMKKAKTVSAYIAAAPKSVRGRLKDIRAAIRALAPDAIEKISYGIPYYHFNGRLIYFSHWTKHIGIYLPSRVLADHTRDLKSYEWSGATIRFPHDRKIPIALIKKLVRARMKELQAKSSKKK